MTNTETPMTVQADVPGTPAPEEAARTGGQRPADESLADNAGFSAAQAGPEIEPHRLDADAVRVVLRLKQSGYEAYLVGGCVRDLMVGLSPKDFDIATSATPNQVRSLFRNSRLIGRRFRLAHVYFKGGKILEVSTFRASPELVDEPQPSEAAEGEVHSEGSDAIAMADQAALDAVEGDAEIPSEPVADVQDETDGIAAAPDLLITEDNTFGSAEEDARRRDFTINGLFYDPAQGRVIDHVNGLRDLAGMEVRTIGDPERRMREDPVRILRAVRFACKLGFDIESRTWAAMEGAVEDLPRCAPPRLLEDTFRLLRGGHAGESIRLLSALDALAVLLSPLDAHLKGEDDAGRTAYYALIGKMDELVRAGVGFDDSMLLACILMPVAMAEPEPDEGEQGGRPPTTTAQAIEQLLQQLVQKARLPRRIAERCRSLLMAQRTLSGQRRRRGGLGGFRAHPLFNEALAVFEVWVKGTGQYVEALAQWKSGQAPAVSNDAEGPRRKRKRRRRGPKSEGNGVVARAEGGGDAADAGAGDAGGGDDNASDDNASDE